MDLREHLRCRVGYETCLESSSEYINQANMNFKASPTHLEESQGPKSDLKISKQVAAFSYSEVNPRTRFPKHRHTEIWPQRARARPSTRHYDPTMFPRCLPLCDGRDRETLRSHRGAVPLGGAAERRRGPNALHRAAIVDAVEAPNVGFRD
jgi:hypothetical protein